MPLRNRSPIKLWQPCPRICTIGTSGRGALPLETEPGSLLSAQDAIQRVIEDGKLASNPDQPIPDAARQAIVDAAGRLRTSLADDIRTRNAPWL